MVRRGLGVAGRCAALLTLAATIALLGGASLGEPGTAAGHAAPNVVVILTDDQTAGSEVRMPYLQSRTDWTRFTNAFVNVSLCCPSRSTILSGRYSHHTGVEDNESGMKFDASTALPVWLHAGGYQTALIGKYLNNYPWTRGNYIPPGWDRWVAFVGTPNYFNYTLNEDGRPVWYGSYADSYSTDVLSRKAADFIRAARSPFFLYFAPYAPHSPTTPPPRYANAFSSTPVQFPPSFNESNVSDKPDWVKGLSLRDANAMAEERRNEWRTLLAVDDGIKEIFDALQATGALGNTIVIFMSDNGYSFGEHRYVGKRPAYEEDAKVPLLVRDPLGTAQTLTQLVSNVDLASTIADAAGVVPALQQDGRSLLPLVRTGGAAIIWRDAVLLHYVGGGQAPVIPGFWGLRTLQYKYVEYDDGEKELYDLARDPYELENVVKRPQYVAIVQDLAARLALLKAS